MPKSKSTGKKSSVKVNDLRAKKNPKGGFCASGEHMAKAKLIVASSSSAPLKIK